jgi:hypothetical protein
MSDDFQISRFLQSRPVSEDQGRFRHAEATAGRWFADLTKPQLARYHQRMADVAPYRDSPRWERERLFANQEFVEGTAEARRVYDLAMHDLMATGEISEATNYAYDEVAVAQMMQEFAA